MANKTDTPTKIYLSWKELTKDFPELEKVNTLEELNTALSQNPDIPMDDAVFQFKYTHPQVFSPTTPDGEKKDQPEKKKKQAAAAPKAEEEKTTDEPLATSFTEDQTYQTLLKEKAEQWEKDHPNATDDERDAYFSNRVHAPDDPLDKLCDYKQSKSQLELDSEEAFRTINPTRAEQYDQLEQSKVYANLEDDPAYRNALVQAKEQTKELQKQSLDQGEPISEEELKKAFTVKKLAVFTTFAKLHPEKTKAYIKKGSPALAKAIGLQHEPTTADAVVVMRQEQSMKQQAASITEQTTIEAAFEAPLPTIEFQRPIPHDMLQDGRYKEIRNTLVDEWQKENKKDILSAPGQDYLYGRVGDQHWRTVYQDAEDIFRAQHPEKSAKYDAQEKLHIYDDPEDDPIFAQLQKRADQASLIARREANDAWIKDRNKTDGKVPDLHHVTMRASAPYMRYLAEHFPEKAKAYAKNHAQLKDIVRYKEQRKQNPVLTPPVFITNSAPEETEDTEAITMSTKNFTKPMPMRLPESDTDTGGDMGGSDTGGGDQDQNQERQPSGGPLPAFRRGQYDPLRSYQNLRKNADRVRSLARGAKKGAGAAEKAAGRGLLGDLSSMSARKLAQEGVQLVAGKGEALLIAIAVILLLVLAIMILSVLLGGTGTTSQNPYLSPLKVRLSGPQEINNNELIQYKITVSYGGVTDDILVSNTIPAGAELETDPPAQTTQPYEYDAESRTITWKLSELQNSGPQPTPQTVAFPETTYIGYGFPSPNIPPEDGSIVMPSETAALWNTNMATHAQRAAQLIDVDMAILGMWPWLEGINYNVFHDNCNDREKNPNTPCPYVNWQVGFGVRPMETLVYLEDALTQMHPGESVQSVGQSVINASAQGGTAITYPSTVFPNIELDTILGGINTRNTNPAPEELEMRTWAAILMKDPAISTYVLGKVFKNLVGPNMATTMEKWPGSYDKQRVINYIYGMYQVGLTNGASFTPQDILFTVRPTNGNSFVVNQAYAELVLEESAP